MTTNTLCLRIFFVLSLLFFAVPLLFIYAGKIVTPLALAWLPTKTAEAHYESAELITTDWQGMAREYFVEITYDSVTTTLVSTRSSSPDPPSGPIRVWNPTKDNPTGLSFTVRYVKAFPTMVGLEDPNPGIRQWITDRWTTRDITQLIPLLLILFLIAYFFRRHLRNSRMDCRR